jgi:hypothetical protein
MHKRWALQHFLSNFRDIVFGHSLEVPFWTSESYDWDNFVSLDICLQADSPGFSAEVAPTLLVGEMLNDICIAGFQEV